MLLPHTPLLCTLGRRAHMLLTCRTTPAQVLSAAAAYNTVLTPKPVVEGGEGMGRVRATLQVRVSVSVRVCVCLCLCACVCAPVCLCVCLRAASVSCLHHQQHECWHSLQDAAAEAPQLLAWLRPSQGSMLLLALAYGGVGERMRGLLEDTLRVGAAPPQQGAASTTTARRN